MSPKAVTVRLQRLSQLRALCLSLGAAGRRAGLGVAAGASAGESSSAGPACAGPERDDRAAAPPPAGGC